MTELSDTCVPVQTRGATRKLSLCVRVLSHGGGIITETDEFSEEGIDC